MVSSQVCARRVRIFFFFFFYLTPAFFSAPLTADTGLYGDSPERRETLRKARGVPKGRGRRVVFGLDQSVGLLCGSPHVISVLLFPAADPSLYEHSYCTLHSELKGRSSGNPVLSLNWQAAYSHSPAATADSPRKTTKRMGQQASVFYHMIIIHYKSSEMR